MQAWRSRLYQQAPRWLSFAIAGLIVLDCAWAIQTNTSWQRALPKVAAASPPTARRAPLDPNGIARAHLFGVWVPDSVVDARAMGTTTALQLHGTFAGADPRHGMAIIAIDNVEKLYRIGDPTDNIGLDSVYPDHVLLKRAGRLERLSLPHGAGILLDAPRHDGGSLHDAPATRRLAEIMSTEPCFDEESQRLLGFRIRPVPPNAQFLRVGLRPGDVITSINGLPLADQDREHGQDVVDKALAASNASVSLLRIGRRLDVTLDLSQ